MSSTLERLREMRNGGIDQTLPGTGRVVKLRSVDPSDVLREGKMPDILTPLLVRGIYEELGTRQTLDFLTTERSTLEAALQMADSINFIAKKALVDDTQIEELTLGEKRWIFQLVLGPAEILANFRLEPEDDVESVAEGEDLQPVTQ